MLVDETTYEQCIVRLGHIPFEQDSGWRGYEAKRGMQYLYFVDNEQHPLLACCGRVIKKPIIGKILDIMGEVKGIGLLSERVMRKFYRSVIEDSGCNMIIYNSKSFYDAEMEIALRRSGFNRPFGSRTCPLTILIDLNRKSGRCGDGDWRRNSKKASESGLSFERVVNPTLKDAITVCRLFDEMSETKHLGYSLEPVSLSSLLSNSEFRLYYVWRNNRVICARIVYVSKEMAEDVFAANSNESRECSATYFMMDNVFDDISNVGAKMFDFSRIPPSNNETDSVYVFKRAAGGRSEAYLGEWIWANNKALPLLYSIYYFYIKKVHHY